MAFRISFSISMNESLVLTDSARLPGALDWEDGSTGRAQSGGLLIAGKQ